MAKDAFSRIACTSTHDIADDFCQSSQEIVGVQQPEDVHPSEIASEHWSPNITRRFHEHNLLNLTKLQSVLSQIGILVFFTQWQ